MNKTNHYIPTDLEWPANGLKCEPRDLNRMCKQILKHGTIANFSHHTSTYSEPGGFTEARGCGSHVLTVTCDHVPDFMYVIHFTGFRVTEIIEIITIKEGGA